MKRKDTTSLALADYDGTETKCILSRQMDSVQTESILSQQNRFCLNRFHLVDEGAGPSAGMMVT